MSSVQFTLHIPAMPTPRPRFVTRGKFVSTYYPKPYVAYTEALKGMIEEILAGAAPMEGPLDLLIEVRLERPKSTKLPAPAADIDNYLKGVMDAMTKAGVWGDDKQVVAVSASKMWAKHDEVYVHIVPRPAWDSPPPSVTYSGEA